ncbi:MAG: phosphotransferase enzyme family protein [Planctomycetota bacterium]|jgi:Ser/Thr protein kinase RdoA (MazF antagonist)
MAAELDLLNVLAAYPDECRPDRIKPLGSAGGFSGACFWRVDSEAGSLCLRRWPKSHPSVDQLEFIQAVLWHVVREGFHLVPLPLATRSRKGYVAHQGYLWELTPWMRGRADYQAEPTDGKLKTAMAMLAEFHLAAATFPLPDPPGSASPGICSRLTMLRALVSGDLTRLRETVVPGVHPELEHQAEQLFELFPTAADRVLPEMIRSSAYRVPLQPCIRDVWHDHVLFDGGRVTGLIDFGSMAPDNVASDVARLLGSMAGDDGPRWQAGLESYATVRPLSETEISLVHAFDHSTVVISGLTWIDWVYRQRKVFENLDVISRRVDEILVRLRHLTR